MGRPVLCDTTSTTVHVLNPAAGALWAALDGRSIREIAGGHGAPCAAELVESVRRLRALGVVLEAATAPLDVRGSQHADEVRPPAIRVHGHTRDTETGLALLVDAGAAAVVRIDGEPTSNVAGVPIQAIVLDEPPIAGRPLTPFDVFRSLVAATVAEDLRAPNALDSLADLAETAPASIVG